MMFRRIDKRSIFGVLSEELAYVGLIGLELGRDLDLLMALELADPLTNVESLL